MIAILTLKFQMLRSDVMPMRSSFKRFTVLALASVLALPFFGPAASASDGWSNVVEGGDEIAAHVADGIKMAPRDVARDTDQREALAL